jgi:hypothetical protein
MRSQLYFYGSEVYEYDAGLRLVPPHLVLSGSFSPSVFPLAPCEHLPPFLAMRRREGVSFCRRRFLEAGHVGGPYGECDVFGTAWQYCDCALRIVWETLYTSCGLRVVWCDVCLVCC